MSLLAKWLRPSLVHQMYYASLVVILVASIPYQGVFLIASRFNYPGGEAMAQFHSKIIPKYSAMNSVFSLYYDVESAMTGATLFSHKHSSSSSVYDYKGRFYDLSYCKNDTIPTDRNFTFVITAHPENFTANLAVIQKIYGFAGYSISTELSPAWTHFQKTLSISTLGSNLIRQFRVCFVSRCGKLLLGAGVKKGSRNRGHGVGLWKLLECLVVHGGCFGGFRVNLGERLYILGPQGTVEQRSNSHNSEYAL